MTTLVEQYTWLQNEILYFIQYGKLSAVDLRTMTYHQALLDSLEIQITSSPFNATHIAYRKHTGDFEPAIFLYDIESGKETFLTSGLPCVFSPEGKQLIIAKDGKYLTCDLATKTVTPLGFEPSYATEVLRWTSRGIISFETGNSGIVVTNETKAEIIGEWPSSDVPTVSHINPSGDHMLTSKFECANGDPSGNCAYRGHMVYSVVDVINKTETKLAESTSYYVALKALSPDQKRLALIGRDNYIYITDN